jgi:hypothetical protein
MSTTQSTTYESSGSAAGAAAIEALDGIGVTVLAILGLAHVAPVFLAGIAAIVAGVALMAQGTAIATEYARMLTGRAELVTPLGASSAWSLELLAGVAGVVLGILALLNIVPVDLLAVSVIAFGAALILSSGPMAQIAFFRATTVPPLDERVRILATQGASTSAVSQGMVGLAAVVLGILALAGLVPLTLTLVAFLVIGLFLLINGSTVSSMMLNVFRR